MRKPLLTFILLFVFLAFSPTLTPRQLFPGLFEAVPLAGISPDPDKFNRIPFISDNFFIPGTPHDVLRCNISAGLSKHIDILLQDGHTNDIYLTR
jgi:alpha,alpha-trehalase